MFNVRRACDYVIFLARNMRAKYYNNDLDFTIYNAILKLCYNLNINVEYSDNDYSLIIEPYKYNVVIPRHTSQKHDNFIITYSIGHILLHNKYPIDVINKAKFVFAAEFLMPKTEFITAAIKYSNDAEKLASMFEVTVSAARVRMCVLKTISKKEKLL